MARILNWLRRLFRKETEIERLKRKYANGMKVNFRPATNKYNDIY